MEVGISIRIDGAESWQYIRIRVKDLGSYIDNMMVKKKKKWEWIKMPRDMDGSHKRK